MSTAEHAARPAFLARKCPVTQRPPAGGYCRSPTPIIRRNDPIWVNIGINAPNSTVRT